MGKRLVLVVVLALAAVATAFVVWRQADRAYLQVVYHATVADGVQPRLAPADAARITLDYLDAQRAELAAPELHIAPDIRGIWALTADQAAGLDGCIPIGMGSRIVWVTKGTGDYLNLADHAWSSPRPGPGDTHGDCAYPAPDGTIVIDDATGEILGVYPGGGGSQPHPSPMVPAPAQ